MLAALTLLVSWSSNNRIDDREMYMNRADMCGILLSCAHIFLFFIIIFNQISIPALNKHPPSICREELRVVGCMYVLGANCQSGCECSVASLMLAPGVTLGGASP